jgi:hypothetical protein
LVLKCCLIVCGYSGYLFGWDLALVTSILNFKNAEKFGVHRHEPRGEDQIQHMNE